MAQVFGARDLKLVSGDWAWTIDEGFDSWRMIVIVIVCPSLGRWVNEDLSLPHRALTVSPPPPYNRAEGEADRPRTGGIA